MDDLEKREIEMLKEKYKPLSAWKYFGYSLLFSTPIGIVFMIMYSFNNTNINRRNFARSHFCIWVIVLPALIFALIHSLVGSYG